jgi:hypothetical protein
MVISAIKTARSWQVFSTGAGDAVGAVVGAGLGKLVGDKVGSTRAGASACVGGAAWVGSGGAAGEEETGGAVRAIVGWAVGVSVAVTGNSGVSEGKRDWQPTITRIKNMLMNN